jgi:hypothetical protein
MVTGRCTEVDKKTKNRRTQRCHKRGAASQTIYIPEMR